METDNFNALVKDYSLFYCFYFRLQAHFSSQKVKTVIIQSLMQRLFHYFFFSLK